MTEGLYLFIYTATPERLMLVALHPVMLGTIALTYQKAFTRGSFYFAFQEFNKSERHRQKMALCNSVLLFSLCWSQISYTQRQAWESGFCPSLMAVLPSRNARRMSFLHDRFAFSIPHLLLKTCVKYILLQLSSALAFSHFLAHRILK